MASARRAARAGLSQSHRADAESPGWLWHYDEQAWRTDDPVPAEWDDNEWDRHVWGLFQPWRRWREGRDAWLRDHGLVVWPMDGLTRAEYGRIEKKEPHRVLRRPSL
ncbi:hypothetical protein PV439_11785 [Streptomyces scabiei]|uniref:hypothetical protein n=1 Tax=Streptomyces scabiei TaxID=1930 RepID=UPI00298FF60B|nr:hypothetical protein [Streptomyces scabiei]MDW8804610.1 hypothetical protein [Streptomyces scabiei]MDX2652310.1 hypothetical protein [Streptomyces scabiei]MDX2869077.1 hypothetical protein [Streptomyces scabiei]MDX2889671.1 hypothetical protein [Streptomyces scabiei]MDX2892023.1 hypothetical protein [Streptomyces scabiei]